MKKAQGSTIQILLGITIIITIALAINHTRTQIIGQTMVTMTETEEAYVTDLSLKSLFNLKMPMGEEQDPITISRAVNHACLYDKEEKYNIRLRPNSPRKNVNHTIETYLNDTVDGNYYFYIRCDEEHLIEINEPPSQDTDIITSMFELPLADETIAQAHLQRWSN